MHSQNTEHFESSDYTYLISFSVSALLREDLGFDIDLLCQQIDNLLSCIPDNYIERVKISYILQSSGQTYFYSLTRKISSLYSFDNLFFHYAGPKGVAISRNMAIQKASSRYLFFLDLDCRFTSSLGPFLLFLETTNYNLFYLMTPEVDRIEKFRLFKWMISDETAKIKIFNICGLLSIFHQLPFIARAATYNIMVQPAYCLENCIKFDPKLGLGAHFHQSDEALFIIQMLKSMSTGSKYLCHFKIPLTAKSESHVRHANLKNSLASKGYVLKRGFTHWSSFFCLPFLSLIFYMKFKGHISFMACFASIYKGYKG